MVYYYTTYEGSEKPITSGPVTESKLLDLFSQQQIDLATPVWAATGGHDWQSLVEVCETRWLIQCSLLHPPSFDCGHACMEDDLFFFCWYVCVCVCDWLLLLRCVLSMTLPG